MTLTATGTCKVNGHDLQPVNNSSLVGTDDKIFRLYICIKCGETTKVEIK